MIRDGNSSHGLGLESPFWDLWLAYIDLGLDLKHNLDLIWDLRLGDLWLAACDLCKCSLCSDANTFSRCKNGKDHVKFGGAGTCIPLGSEKVWCLLAAATCAKAVPVFWLLVVMGRVDLYNGHKMAVVTYAGCVAAGVGGRAFSRVCLCVSLSVRALKGKRLELSTPNLVRIYSIVVARHSLTQRSKGQRSRSHG